jgi:ribose transport system ATP-binding protein
LGGVDFDVRPGEVHALCGENGAGKSTLMRVLSGAFRPDSGEITFKGARIEFRSTRDALSRGILLVHQEISLVPGLTVAENILLGALPAIGGFVSRRDLFGRAMAILAEAGGEFEKIDPRARVGTLTFARQQMVEIARAMALNCSIVIFDEPTSSLTSAEALSLFEPSIASGPVASASSTSRARCRRSSRSPTASLCFAMARCAARAAPPTQTKMRSPV